MFEQRDGRFGTISRRRDFESETDGDEPVPNPRGRCSRARHRVTRAAQPNRLARVNICCSHRRRIGYFINEDVLLGFYRSAQGPRLHRTCSRPRDVAESHLKIPILSLSASGVFPRPGNGALWSTRDRVSGPRAPTAVLPGTRTVLTRSGLCRDRRRAKCPRDSAVAIKIRPFSDVIS